MAFYAKHKLTREVSFALASLYHNHMWHEVLETLDGDFQVVPADMISVTGQNYIRSPSGFDFDMYDTFIVAGLDKDLLFDVVGYAMATTGDIVYIGYDKQKDVYVAKLGREMRRIV